MSEQTRGCKRMSPSAGPCKGCFCAACERKRKKLLGIDTRSKVRKKELSAGKPRMDLLAFDVLEAMAIVMTHGVDKHGARNWEGGADWVEDYFAPALRHLTDWRLKRGPDPDTDCSHLDHAICCLMILSAYEKRQLGEDDR